MPKIQAMFVGSLTLILLGLPAFSGLEITKVTVPRWIENGTKTSVVLDCEYSYSTEDRHLVVKWFLNNDPEPIYQWIPELHSRQPSYRLQDRINMSYTIFPSSEFTKYRALKILRPTTDLSGKYTCNVASIADEDSESQWMVIYVLPRKFEFNYTIVTEGSVNFTCEVDGVFPLPVLTVHLRSSSSPLHNAEKMHVQNSSSYYNGVYNVQVFLQLNDDELFPEEHIVECVLFIPGTDIKAKKTLHYFPSTAPKNNGKSPRDSRNHMIIVTGIVVMVVSDVFIKS
ncbi:uncharacterized protein LOC106473667 [Limulus polyphemus]|uniref:Uncharacterized protein LOC106473667 n=1 Tax=Limulus polyphemus TaxID=6850 RepID=A0ABM1BW36_LIMPO|nr:uncharacterized protein LOC106473667 [Limulus polyphemus]